jgi:hypothetical protein
MHEVVFAVKQKNTDKLHDLLMNISDPSVPTTDNIGVGRRSTSTLEMQLLRQLSRNI